MNNSLKTNYKIYKVLPNSCRDIIYYILSETIFSLMPEPNPDHSFEERVARWKLKMLDKNSNDVRNYHYY